MTTRKTTAYYTVLVAISSLAIGMVIASRLDLSPASSAQGRLSPAPPANSTPLDGPIDALTFRRIAQAQTPAVVNIRTESSPRGRQLTMIPDDLLRRFFEPGGEPPQPEDAPPEQSTGTGFVIDADGYVLTNNHVVEGADRIFVSQFGAGRTEEYEAELVGHDVLTDSALIRLTDQRPDALGVVTFGDSDQMQPGDWVMAIGNPFGLGHTVTVGVVSARGRPFGGVSGREQNMLQTDAAINPGNSGGPLLNIRGEVVGINTSIIADQRAANLGIGFAMPINLIRDILPQLRRGKVIRGVIGVQISRDPITPRMAEAFGLPGTNGAVVSAVTEDGPADEGGVQPGDVIIEYNGQLVADSSALVDMVVRTEPGTTVPVVVIRDRERVTLHITVDELDLEAERGGTMGRDDRSEEPTETGLGMELQALTPDIARQLEVPTGRGGAVVSAVELRSPASNASMARGDVILKVNNEVVTSLTQVVGELQRARAGDVVFLLVWRGGQEVFVTLNKP
jgi:serine protease Do